MFEDSYLDSFMESYIGGWTGDEDAFYEAQEQQEHWDAEEDNEDSFDEDEEDWVEPMDLGDLLNHNQRHLDEDN
jgi:hypothetical protein